MKDIEKPKEQLINELAGLRQRITELEALETERKQAEETLKESEHKYRALFESTLDGAFVIDAETMKVVLANQAAAKTYEFDSVEDAVGASLLDFVPPEDRERVIRIIVEDMFEKDLRQVNEFRTMTKDGREIWISAIGVRTEYQGRLAGLVSFRDITERKHIEEALRESEEFSSSLLNSSPIPMLVINPDTSIRYVNPALERLTDFSSAEVIGRKAPYPWWTKETLQKTSRDLEQAMRKGAVGLKELFQKKNGERFWVEITSAPVTSNGEFKYYLANWVDITERKQMEELYTALASSSIVGVYIVQDGRLQFVNPSFQRETGLSEHDLLGTDPLAIVHPEDRGMVRQKAVKMLKGESSLPYEFRLVDTYENLKSAMEVVTSVNYKGKRAVLGCSMDITERKQVAERDKELQQELYLSSRLASVGELAAVVAHEINNPLTGILGFSQRLLRKSTDEEISRDLERIHSEAQRAAKVVQNLLTFARRREPEKEYSDINDILQKALELRAYELKTSNIEVATDFTPDLPRVMVDFRQIQEVFLNIILNAEQVMTEANRGGKLTIKTREIKDHIRVSFTDDGPGIPAEHLDKLFDPFFTTRGERGGTGLGLSVCHGIVTEHGGRVYAKSKPGQGTTFFVQLPLPSERIEER
jgi:two-component system NtrC family sensor kinase